MSELSRLTGVFFEPSKAFADIAARPRWFVPWLLLAIFTFGGAMVFAQKGLFRVADEQAFATNQQFQQSSPEQREAQLEFLVRIQTIGSYFSPVLLTVFYLLVAVVLWAIASGILSAPVRFGQTFAIVIYSFLPSVIKGILLVIVAQIKNPRDFNLQNPLMFNPAAYMDPQTSSKFLYTALSFLDLFNIWIVLLLAAGLKAAGGKKLSFGGALFAVILPWSVIILVASAFAGLRG